MDAIHSFHNDLIALLADTQQDDLDSLSPEKDLVAILALEILSFLPQCHQHVLIYTTPKLLMSNRRLRLEEGGDGFTSIHLNAFQGVISINQDTTSPSPNPPRILDNLDRMRRVEFVCSNARFYCAVWDDVDHHEWGIDVVPKSSALAPIARASFPHDSGTTCTKPSKLSMGFLYRQLLFVVLYETEKNDPNRLLSIQLCSFNLEEMTRQDTIKIISGNFEIFHFNLSHGLFELEESLGGHRFALHFGSVVHIFDASIGKITGQFSLPDVVIESFESESFNKDWPRFTCYDPLVGFLWFSWQQPRVFRVRPDFTYVRSPRFEDNVYRRDIPIDHPQGAYSWCGWSIDMDFNIKIAGYFIEDGGLYLCAFVRLKHENSGKEFRLWRCDLEVFALKCDEYESGQTDKVTVDWKEIGGITIDEHRDSFCHQTLDDKLCLC